MKYILVTGAYGGMGRKTTEFLAEKGFTVFALDQKTECAQKNIIPIQADITDEETIRSAVQRVKEVTDTLFAIVHFAGIYMLDSLAEMKREDFERIFRINVFGAFQINKEFLPLLKNVFHNIRSFPIGTGHGRTVPCTINYNVFTPWDSLRQTSS